MNFETIKFEVQENGIGILTLNRPEKLNAMNFQMSEELHQVLDQLIINLDCRVLVLKAEGRAFCAGLDLNESTILDEEDSVVTNVIGLTSILLRTVCWQNVDFPAPGGPTSKIMLLGGTSCN